MLLWKQQKTPRNNLGGLEAVVRGGYVSQRLRSCGDSDLYLLYSMSLDDDIFHQYHHPVGLQYVR